MGKPPRRRGLSSDDIALWRQVTKTIAARRGMAPPDAPPAPAAGSPPEFKPHAAGPRPASAPGYTPPQSTPQRPPLAPLEKQLRRRLMRGSIEVDDVIDLHGMRQHEAHDALRGFLARAQARGARLVLVVTGKGRVRALGEPDAGVLRRAVPQWLREPALRTIVIGFENAAQPHGGTGALYVRVRRRERG